MTYPATAAAGGGWLTFGLTGGHIRDYYQVHGQTQTMKPDPRLATPQSLDTTVELLNRVKLGDSAALDALLDRCLPPLRRWARGRLPQAARSVLDTQDLVQDTIVKSLRRLEQFESRHEGALQAYLRQAVLNRIRDEVRRIVRRPAPAELSESQPAEQASPLDVAIGRQGVQRYEAALQRLRPSDREAIIGRFEMQHDYKELALMLGKANANAARVAVTRALARLLEQMDDEV